ncbi:IS5 family transposase [Streptosporangium sp. NPDC005286]|uniref:IS5 family transposase n=1 Tax=Streptosporangium sp. NPDC005286 TaxID=3154463 RepID=UPI0033BBC2EC
MVRRGELTDKAWQRIEPLLPATDGRGRPWRGHRQVINGILWRLRTGAPWRDIPERYGPWQTCYERFEGWDEDGTWGRLLEEMQVEDDSIGNVEWTFSIDSTISRAHQHFEGRRGLVYPQPRARRLAGHFQLRATCGAVTPEENMSAARKRRRSRCSRARADSPPLSGYLISPAYSQGNREPWPARAERDLGLSRSVPRARARRPPR